MEEIPAEIPVDTDSDVISEADFSTDSDTAPDSDAEISPDIASSTESEDTAETEGTTEPADQPESASDYDHDSDSDSGSDGDDQAEAENSEESGSSDESEDSEMADTSEEVSEESAQTDSIDGDSIEDPENTTDPESSVLEYDSITYINPIYEDIISDSDFSVSEPLLCFSAASSSASSAPVYETLQEAAEYMRSQMVNRVSSFSFSVVTATKPNLSQLVAEIRDLVFLHTSSPVESDYIAYQYKNYSANRTLTGSAGSYNNLLTFTVTYYTSAAQEAEMTAKVADILSDLNLNGKTQYQKIRAIYDYICTHVTYDYTNDPTTYYLMYTGYAALVNGTAVCQGISVAFYRLCLECGIDVRVVRSVAMKHAWNIVDFSGGTYYELDATWDITYYKNNNQYKYFLRGTSFWASGHIYNGVSVTGELSYGTNDSTDVTDEYYIPSTDVHFLTNLMSDPAKNPDYGCIMLSTEAAEVGDLISVSGSLFPVTALKVISSGIGNIQYITGSSFVMPDSDVAVSGFFSDAYSSLSISDVQAAYLDGVRLAAESGSLSVSDFSDGDLITVVTYSTGLLDHSDYPEALSVYIVKYGLFFALDGLTDLLKYNGTSIRCFEPYGMRVEYSVPQAAYTNGTIESEFGDYTVQEFGTLAVWSSSGAQEPVLGCSGCMNAFAFNSSYGYDDSSMSGNDTDDQHFYTNAFTFTNYNRVLPDLTIRPYFKLSDSSGKEITLYGGTVVRSIQYVASQQDLADPDLSDENRKFIQSIVDFSS